MKQNITKGHYGKNKAKNSKIRQIQIIGLCTLTSKQRTSNASSSSCIKTIKDLCGKKFGQYKWKRESESGLGDFRWFVFVPLFRQEKKRRTFCNF